MPGHHPVLAEKSANVSLLSKARINISAHSAFDARRANYRRRLKQKLCKKKRRFAAPSLSFAAPGIRETIRIFTSAPTESPAYMGEDGIFSAKGVTHAATKLSNHLFLLFIAIAFLKKRITGFLTRKTEVTPQTTYFQMFTDNFYIFSGNSEKHGTAFAN